MTWDQIIEVKSRLENEGHPELFVPPLSDRVGLEQLPENWSTLLSSGDYSVEKIVNEIWFKLADLLPRTIDNLRTRLQGLALLRSDTKQPSLLYLFSKRGEVFPRRGYIPAHQLPAVASVLPIDLRTFYDVHDGWVDLYSGDAGLLPTQEWHFLTDGSEQASPEFLAVYGIGATLMGFDLTNSPPSAHIIWADEDVSGVENFWARLDGWVSDELQDMDRRPGA